MPDATIYDVAREAGVSISTVSRVLNSTSHVNKTTRARVLNAINALGFVPKAEAMQRARKGLQRIGVLGPFFSYPSSVQRLRGVDRQLACSPYELVLYNVNSAERRDAYLSSLPLVRRLDGLIMMALPPDDLTLHWLAASDLRAVLVECAHPALSSVEIDDQAGGRMAAAYLVERGHRQIGFVGDADAPKYAIHPSEKRLRSFRDELARLGVPLPECYVVLGEHGVETVRHEVGRLLEMDPRPTAIFAASDILAIGVLKAAQERGLRVPDDLAIVGFDDLDMSEYIGLTTIRQPLDESGRVAADVLLAHLVEPHRPPQRINLPVTLIRRATA